MKNNQMPITSEISNTGFIVTPDVYMYTTQIANMYMLGDPAKDNDWIIIDTGMPGKLERIKKAMNQRFGSNIGPKAIILTHGHFDHVGNLQELIKGWDEDVPVYAHSLELPHLTGKANYPKADPGADKGLVAKMSPAFSREAVDISEHVYELPEDGSIPFFPEWTWYHTPGHTKGHISLFREKDRLLIAGDAFVTVKQESLYKVMAQEPELSGPPKYLTENWSDAEASVKKLAGLEPEKALTGHGRMMEGEELRDKLHDLSDHFVEKAVPKKEKS